MWWWVIVGYSGGNLFLSFAVCANCVTFSLLTERPSCCGSSAPFRLLMMTLVVMCLNAILLNRRLYCRNYVICFVVMLSIPFGLAVHHRASRTGIACAIFTQIRAYDYSNAKIYMPSVSVCYDQCVYAARRQRVANCPKHLVPFILNGTTDCYPVFPLMYQIRSMVTYSFSL